MAKKNQVEWQERFDHNEHTYLVMGKNLNMGTERFVTGPLRGLRPDYASAEWGLINSTVVKLYADGELIWKTGDDIEKLPYEEDDEGVSTGDALLNVLISRRFRKLADKHPEPFADYIEENGHEDLAGMASLDNAASSKPTLVTPSEPTE